MKVGLQPVVAEPVEAREAVEFFLSKGLAPPDGRFDFRDWAGTAHARGFVVAKAMQDDVLQLIRGAVAEALEEGRTLEQFRADLEPRLRAAGWWGRKDMVDPRTGEWTNVQLGSQRRLEVIFDTNLKTAWSAGRWQRIQRQKDRFPYLMYRQLQRPTRREEHEPFHDIILPVDHPFWLTHFPPNGYLCGCLVRQLSEGALRRRGLSVSPDPDVRLQKILNRRTGREEDVPEGITPGFDNNPGATFLAVRGNHARVAGPMARETRARELGLTDEARARGLRTGVEHAGAIDLETGEMLDWTSGDRTGVSPSDRVMQMLADPARRISVVHNHPSSGPFSTTDLKAIARLPGLDSLVVAGHDGGVFKVRAAARELAQAVEPAYMFARTLLERAQDLAGIDDRQAFRIVAHIASRALANRGLMRYDHAMGPGLQLTSDRFGDEVIEDLVADVTDFLESENL